MSSKSRYDEAGLNEVLVESESGRQVHLAHDDEGDAVDQTPLLVSVTLVQIER